LGGFGLDPPRLRGASSVLAINRYAGRTTADLLAADDNGCGG